MNNGQISGSNDNLDGARRGRRSGCSPSGIKANGRLRRGYRWAKGRKRCAIPARSR